MKNFIYYPFGYKNFENPYCINFVDWLEDFNLQDETPKRFRLLSFKKMYSRNTRLGVINWLDNNLIDDKGRFYLRGAIKSILIMIWFRAFCSKILLVKHNHYPHAADKRDIRKIKFFMRTLEFLSTRTIKHDFENLGSNEIFIPHPLYKNVSSSLPFQIKGNYYSYFGRIDKYKEIEVIIHDWPVNYDPLYIVGEGKDEMYLQKIKKLSDERSNIFFIRRRLSDAEAGAFIKKSDALIIPNQGSDMIVSGVIYFGLSYEIPIIGFKLNHIKNMSKEFPEIFYSLNKISDIEFLEVADTECVKKAYVRFRNKYYSTNPLKILNISSGLKND